MYMNIYTKRWGHTDRVEIEKTNNGWKIEGLVWHFAKGESNRKGEPNLFKILEHEGVFYPKDLCNCLEHLWDNYEDLGEKRCQEELNVLVEWLNNVERTIPNTKFWKTFL